MPESESAKFNNVLGEIIKKSLFTERQIEIILKQKHLAGGEFAITRGAYYRQVSQSRRKLMSLYYSVALLRALGVLLPSDISMMSQLSEKISVIKDSDIFPEKEAELLDVIDMVIRQTVDM